MSSEEIRPAAQRFIAEPQPGVLAIRGHWGVGKTYFWRETIKKSAETKAFTGLYAYVSLFGVGDLHELKEAIVSSYADPENPQPGQFARTWRESKRLLQHPVLKQVVPLSPAFAFPWVRDTLVCFDDIERRGSGLEINHVFGLVSLLREERGCKIVLIFNDAFLEGSGAGDFRRAREKLFDLELEFSPSVDEAFSYGFKTQTPLRGEILSRCRDLGIKNIRTIQRIERYWMALQGSIVGCEQAIKSQLVHSLVLFVWSRNEGSDGAPPLEFIRTRTIEASVKEFEENEAVSADERKWRGVISQYGFRYLDELDHELLQYVEQGYATPKLQAVLAEFNNKTRHSQERDAYFKIWEMFTGSFNDNEDQFVRELERGIRASLEWLPLHNLSEAAVILRKLNREGLADELIDEYFEVNRGRIAFASLDFLEESTRDPRLIDKVKEERERAKPTKTIGEVLIRVAGASGWGVEDEKFLAACTVDHYYRFFKAENSSRLRECINFCLRFERSSDDDSKKIAAKARSALRRIAAESSLNRLRVKQFWGIDPEHAEDDI